MKHHIRRGTTLIGTITCPSEAGAPVFGLEVLAASAFPGVDSDADSQFESFEVAENYLHRVYELHCEREGITPEPRPVVADAAEDTAEAYYLRLQVEADEEAAYYAEMQERDVLANENIATVVEPPAPPSADAQTEADLFGDNSRDDDFPF